MLYLRINDNLDEIIRTAVGEMINIMYNTTYFINGVIQKNPTPKHNIYTINGVECEVCYPSGYVIIYDNKFNATLDIITIKQMYDKLIIELTMAKFNLLKPTWCNYGTTQYMSIINNVEKKLDVIISGEEITEKFKYHFTWIVKKNGKIPNLENEDVDVKVSMRSVNTIIIDSNDTFNLTSGYKCIDYPALKDYTLFNSPNIFKKSIMYSAIAGIDYEINNIYSQSSQNDIWKKMYITPKNMFYLDAHTNVYWQKWENLNIYQPITMSDLNLVNQIKNGLFESTIDDDTKSDYNYKCAITGLPIYEDCYVFDIYEQDIIKLIHKKEISKYQGAKIIDVNKLLKQTSTSQLQKNDIPFLEREDDRQLFNKKINKDEMWISYKKIYDEPKCLLISPVFMHSYKNNMAHKFMEITNTKLIIYRSFCPVTLKSVIDKMDISDMHKKILHSLNTKVEVKYSNDMYEYDSELVTLVSNEYIYNLLQKKQTVPEKILANYW